MKNNKTPIKIKDIAQIAEVSTGTVDRVLHNRSDVSKITREKVLRIIDEFDYKTNIIAKTLASKNQIVFSVLIPEHDKYSSYWQKPLIGMQKAEKELATYGIQIKKYFFNLSDINSFKSKATFLLEENPNAVVLAPIFKKEALKLTDILSKKNIPFVLLDSILDEKNDSVGYVGYNSYQSGVVAAKLIHTRIEDANNILLVNLLSNFKNLNHLSQRSDGFRSFFAKKNKTGTIVELNIHNLDENSISKKLSYAFDDILRIKAIFVTNSKVHIVAKFLIDKQLDQDIVLVGYDLIDENIQYLKNDAIDYLISQNPVEQGYSSIMKLFKFVILKEEPKKITYLPIDIIIKENLIDSC
ncbi:MAG: substrate-binding domain-containing protein [Flavobacteriaceae bacterium]|nr:substrate-binding domain-containing protein [Flavobacteriaceae bacterium]